MRTRALKLGQALAARGHKVWLLLPPWDDPERAGQAWDEGGVRVINMTLPPGLPLIFHILLTGQLVAAALALKPEIVHFFKPKAYAGLAHLALWWLRRLGGPKLRLVVDEDDWEQAWNEVLPYTSGQKRFFAWQERWGLRQADAVTAASRTLEQLVIAARQGDPSGVFYLPNGYATEDRRPETTTPHAPRPSTPSLLPVIMLYTRFVEFRLERVVTLVRKVAVLCPQARWLIVGRGLNGEEELLRSQLNQAGLLEMVQLLGWPVADLAACFAAAAAAAFPYDDTLINRTKCSVKLIDLLAAGVPVVADAVGQNVEYIQDGVSGRLTPPEDDGAMAQALAALVQTPELGQTIGQAARQHIEQQFSWSKLALVAEEAYSL